MKDTGFYVPEEKRDRLAKAYIRDEENRLVQYEGSFLGIRNRMDRKAVYESGGAGLVSTIEDYSVFARMLLDRGSFGKTRILNPEAVDRMLNAGLNDRQQAAFDGWLGCSFFNYPRENMTLLVMQQQLNGGDVVTGVKKALVRRMEGRERGQEG